MAAAEVAEQTPAPSTYPDYMLDPDAVIKDEVEWRHSTPPDYSTTRKFWAQGKTSNHAPSSLETLVENFVKNWEIEASHKPHLSDWRTIDPTTYTFAINGNAPQDASHMLQVGTYSAIIASNQYYGVEHTTLEKSHDTFRDMMPNFAWEVLEVYSGPPVCVFRWRHWGIMRREYVGLNNKGQRVTIKPHNNTLDIQGVTVAKINSDFKVTSLETWFDPLELFNQMKPSDETMTVVEVKPGEEVRVDVADTTARIRVEGEEILVKVADQQGSEATATGLSQTKGDSGSGGACPLGFTSH